ncbi:MAG: hypothetical protein RIB58_12535 [Phycisphaerales bacterium]
MAAYAVEGQLPRPIDELCIAWRVVGDQLVVVAVDHELADHWLAEGLLSAYVAALPEGLLPKTGPIEFFARSYLPVRIRRHRRHRVASLGIMLGLGCLATAYGLHQRTATMLNQARSADAATLDLAREALPQWREGASPQLALTGELRRLRALASGDRDDEQVDSRDALAALFEAWPAGEGFQVEAVEAAADRLMLRTIAPSREAAIALADRITNAGTFASGLPQVQTERQRDGEVTRLEVSLVYAGGPQ